MTDRATFAKIRDELAGIDLHMIPPGEIHGRIRIALAYATAHARELPESKPEPEPERQFSAGHAYRLLRSQGISPDGAASLIGEAVVRAWGEK